MSDPQLRRLLDGLAAGPAGDEGPAAGPWLSRRFVVPPGASVTVDTDDRDAMVAVHHAVPYGVTAPGPSRWRVVVRTTGSFPSVPYPFAGVPLVELAPGLRGRAVTVEDGTAYWIDQHETLIHARPAEALLLAYCPRPVTGVFWAVRLVRHAMTAQLRADGTAVWVRAAACVIDDVDVLIAGPAAAGTTTVLLTCLRLLGAHFVADDRVLVRRDPHRLIGYPWPSPVRIADGTLRAFPDLRTRLGAPDERPDAGPDVLVGPEDIPGLLTRGAVTDHLRPRLMLWPALALDAPGTPPPLLVTPDEVRSVLGATRLFDDGTLEPEEPPFGGPPRLAGGAVRDVVNLMAAQLACYRVAVTREPRYLAAQITDLRLRLRYRLS